MHLTRILCRFFSILCIASTWVPIPQANAQPACDGRFVGKVVRFIVSNQAGGGYDIYARMVAPHYARATGADALVENWPGGKGLIGANKIISSTPNGLTFGLINAPKLIASKLVGDPNAVDILDDFHVIARVARSRHIWVVSAKSDINSIRQIIFAEPARLFGTTDMRSAGLIATVLITELLQFNFDVVYGMGGSRKKILSLIRGDIDFLSSSYSSLLSNLESRDARAILQVSSVAIEESAVLTDVPLLGGINGVAAQRASQLGTNVQEAVELADATEAFVGAGRILVGPAGFEPKLAECIEHTFVNILSSPALRLESEQLRRPLDVASGRKTAASLKSSFTVVNKHLYTLKKKLSELAR